MTASMDTGKRGKIMIVKNCRDQDVDLNRFTRIVLIERSDAWRGKHSKYVVGAESDPIGIHGGCALANQVMLEEFNDFEAAKRSKMKFEEILRATNNERVD